MPVDKPSYRSIFRERSNLLCQLFEPLRSKFLRQLSFFSFWAVPGLVFGCATPPPTFQQVITGHITMAAEDREALRNLLETSGIRPEALAILKEGAQEGAGSFARLAGDRVVALRLGLVKEAAMVGQLTEIRQLSIEGDFETFSLQGLSSLELLILTLPQDTLRNLKLSSLASLHTLEVSGGKLDEGLHLEKLPSLENLGLLQCGLHRAPRLSDMPVTGLNLAGNQIQDLEPLATLPTLVSLHLSSNGISSLETLPPLPNLRSLFLGHNPLTPNIRLTAGDFPKLNTLDLRFTGLTRIPQGLQGLPVKWDESQTRQMEFNKTLEHLRIARRAIPGEFVAEFDSTGGTQFNTEGSCQWKTSTYHRAEVNCRLSIASLRGLAAARLGTTDLVLPFQGGGSPRVQAELSVEEGTAALYVRESFDLVETARQMSELPAEIAEEARQPQDRFDGYRRLEARPGAPAKLEGEPSLLGSRVVLWLEAKEEARSLTLVVQPL